MTATVQRGVGPPTPQEDTPKVLREVLAECDTILALAEQAERYITT